MPTALAAVIVFVTSGAVLVLEILAGRLLAPYVGVTLETFTGIIGVVLAGIAIGTWAGGWLADRYDPRRLLPVSIVLGGGTAILAVPLIRTLGSAVGTGGGPAAVVVLSTVGFFVPSVVLSAASPLVIKIQLTDLALTGQVVGRLSAVGTAGSLVGVFVTGFVLVAAFPTTPVIVAVGMSLVVGGVGLWWYLGVDRHRPQVLTAGVLLAAAGTGLAVITPDRCDVESAYFCARVMADTERDRGRILVLDTLRHSYVDLDDPTYLGFAYVEVLGRLVDSMAPGPLTVVHVGGGGFTLPRYVDAVRPGSDNLVLELDPTLVEIAEDDLGLVRSDRLRVRTGDARTNLRAVDDDSVDLVIGDAFGGLAVPWHLTTTEFLADIDRVLTEAGIYAVNVIDGPPLDFARAQVATARRVFGHVAVVAPPQRLRGERGGNFVVLASQRPLPIADLEQRFGDEGMDDVIWATEADVDAFVDGARVLTDDFAPVDQLLTSPR